LRYDLFGFMKNRLLIYFFLLLSLRGYGQCSLDGKITQSAPTICSGYTLTLTAVPSKGTPPYTYAWSTGETTASINVNKAGTYTVTISDKSAGCPSITRQAAVTVSTTPNAPTAKGVTVCQNTQATLVATAPGGTYQWYDAATGGNFLASGDTYTTPPITANSVFFVETTVGGCTSPRSPVFVSLSTKPTVSGAAICSGNVATLTASGGTSYIWYSSANGNTILSTSDTYTTPVLTASQVYYVASVSGSCISARTAVFVQVTAAPPKPTAANLSVCYGTSANLHANAPAGVFNWYATPSGGVPLISSPDYTTPPLTANTNYYVETEINGCESARAKVTVTVNPLPVTPATQNVTTCYKSSATLTGMGSPAGIYEWYDAPTGGNLLASGATFKTPVLSNSITYYIQDNSGGCISDRAAINVTVLPQLAAPTVAGSIICSGSSTTLTAIAGGGTFEWYSVATGGAPLATGATYTTPALKANTTYYVQNSMAGCISPRAAVTVSVLAAVPVPTAPGTSICSGSTAALTATGSTGNYAWYDSATGNNLLSIAQVFVTPALTTTTTYYVEASTNTCASPRVAVKVTVNPIPAPPTSPGATICPGTSATITATGTGTLKWYDAAANGNLLATGATYKTPILTNNTVYYVESVSATCESSRTPVTVTINPQFNPQFQYPSGTFCAGGANPTPKINNPSGGTFSASPAGLVFVSNQTGEINIAASIPGKYVISFAGKGACGTIEKVTVSIVLTTNASFSYNGPYCQDGANPLPTFPAGSTAGVFSSSPAGLVFVNTSTGEIDLAKSQPNTYTITNTINASGTCPASVATTSVTINPGVFVSAGPDQTVAAGTPVQLAGSITGGTTSGTWSGGKGSFSNPALPNAVYTPGAGETTATLTLTSADPPGPCGPRSDKVIITFVLQPAGPTAKSTINCAGSSATLSATAPGGNYQWYDAPTGGNLLATGPNYTTPPLNVNSTFYVQTTIGGVPSKRTAVNVTVNAVPTAPVAAGTAVCTGSPATLTASGSAGSYEWYDAAAGGNLVSTKSTYTTPPLAANTSYYVQAINNTCTSPRTEVDVTVNQIPVITSASTGTICGGEPQSYVITADLPAATFNWSRAKVAGISNPAVSNQTASTITEALINTGTSIVNVTYVITPIIGTCSGPSFNYVVTVYPTPVVTSPAKATICNMSTDNYSVTFNIPGTTFSWSRAVAPGISNAAVTGQTAGTIKEVLFNTTNGPIDVTYVFTYRTSTCTGIPFNLVITVNPEAIITSPTKQIACTGSPQDYVITSNIPGATFNWSRAAVQSISNPAVSGKTSNTIAEKLINTSLSPVPVIYVITPMANGCVGTPFQDTAVVNPQLVIPVASGNSPICVGSTIHLTTPPVVNATYSWTGPNGYTSSDQNPNIPNATAANAGVYTLTFNVKGCNSVPVSVVINVDQPPIVDAGPDQVVCPNSPNIILAGNVSGGTTTGIWTTAGTGTFKPSSNILNAQYIPSAADMAAGSILLTLTSTSKDNCNIASASMKVSFGPLQAVHAGPNQSACIQTTGVQLGGTIAIPGGATWTTSGSGTFNPSAQQLNAVYVPSAADLQAGSVKLTLTANSPGPCYIASDVMQIQFLPGFIPVATSNSPVCVGSPLNLTTAAVAGATYSWTGPNGFTSTDQNPTIAAVTAANAGTYSVTVSLTGCTTLPGSINVTEVQQPIVNAGPPQLVCIADPNINLSGTLGGSATTAMWTTAGTGTFSSPTNLKAQYFPTAADKAAGSVVLTLTSTDVNACTPASSSVTITFGPLPAVNAGTDQVLCSQVTSVQLAGSIIIAGGGTWSTSGSGTFTPSATQLNASYVPSADDIKSGGVTLTLTASNPGVCYIPSDDMKLTFIPPPTVYAGGTRYVLKGNTITLTPTVSDNNVTYLWTPNTDISDNTVKDPTITGDKDITYTLTVTDVRGCVSQDTARVIVSPTITINNTFTPNGDGINDHWDIVGLIAYQNATVDIFDRYGQKVFHSLGYPTPWDGTLGGKRLPVGVYYYVINTNYKGQVLSGYVTIIR